LGKASHLTNKHEYLLGRPML